MRKSKKNTILSVVLSASMTLSFLATSCENTLPVEEETGNVVTFDYNDGEYARPYSVLAKDGETVTAPVTPTRKGYDFDNWYTAVLDGTPVTFPYTPTGDITFYARWSAMKCDVIFDLGYDDEKIIEEVEYNKQVAMPEEVPVRDGYEFRYWKNANGEEVAFPYTVKNDMTFYAHWRSLAVEMYTVSFDLAYENAETMKPLQREEGERITERQAGKPTRAHHRFMGWSTTTSEEDIVDFPYYPTQNITLTAIWSRLEYSITFDVNNLDAAESTYKELTVLGGESVAYPETDPARAGYTFDGWFTTAVGGEKIEFPVTPTRGATYYAHWTKTPVTPERNIFDAEFTVIDPSENFPGYSGGARGTEIILPDDTNSAFSTKYPLNSKNPEHKNHYVTFLYKEGATLSFVINSDKEVNNVTLYLSLAYEIINTGSLTIAPNGEYGYAIIVNDTPLDYAPITITGTDVSGGGQFKGTFSEYKVSVTITLKKGQNVIQLMTNNATPSIGGTTTATAPMVDYIRLDGVGDATLTWSPVYDNIYKTK